MGIQVTFHHLDSSFRSQLNSTQLNSHFLSFDGLRGDFWALHGRLVISSHFMFCLSPMVNGRMARSKLGTWYVREKRMRPYHHNKIQNYVNFGSNVNIELKNVSEERNLFMN